MRPAQNRQPMGIPIGGQYATAAHPEAGIALSSFAHRQSMAERRELLKAGGYVPATTLTAATSPKTAADREEWWNRNFVSAEYGADKGKSYPQMPDDYTPAQTLGQAMSGKRRTHRMNYGNKDIDLRMPSATSIKRYSGDHGNPTFDVPVSVAIRGGEPKQTWVRVTKTGPHSWETTHLGGAEGTEASVMVSEAVAAVLESRRPSMALAGVDNLIKARRKREAAKGAEMNPISSSFIDEVGYDPATNTMATRIGDKLYGHRVNEFTFAAMANSERPGTVFNKLVRTVQGAGVERCGNCGRFSNIEVTHVCPKGHRPAADLNPEHTERARRRAEIVAGSRSHGVQVEAPAKEAPAKAAAAEPKAAPAAAPAKPAVQATAPKAPVRAPGLKKAPARAAAQAGAPKAAPARPAHLVNPIMDNRVYRREVEALQGSGSAAGFDVRGNGPARRAEVSVSAGSYEARIDVEPDGSLKRSVNDAPVDAFAPGQADALRMESWARENALAMARITDAERRRRPAAAGTV